MVAVSDACTVTLPTPVVVSDVTPVMAAVTGSLIVFSAMEIPIETATPADPPMEPDTAAAPASAVIFDASEA